MVIMGPMVQRQPATASGVALYICHRCSPHVADTPVGEIRGYAQLQPLAGWRITSPLAIAAANAPPRFPAPPTQRQRTTANNRAKNKLMLIIRQLQMTIKSTTFDYHDNRKLASKLSLHKGTIPPQIAINNNAAQRRLKPPIQRSEAPARDAWHRTMTKGGHYPYPGRG